MSAHIPVGCVDRCVLGNVQLVTQVDHRTVELQLSVSLSVD